MSQSARFSSNVKLTRFSVIALHFVEAHKTKPLPENEKFLIIFGLLFFTVGKVAEKRFKWYDLDFGCGIC